MTTQQDMLTKLLDMMDAILTAPKMWGSMEAVELQFLLLLEMYSYVQDTSVDARFIVEAYDDFLEHREMSRPLHSNPKVHEAQMTSLLREFSVRLRSGPTQPTL